MTKSLKKIRPAMLALAVAALVAFAVGAKFGFVTMMDYLDGRDAALQAQSASRK